MVRFFFFALFFLVPSIAEASEAPPGPLVFEHGYASIDDEIAALDGTGSLGARYRRATNVGFAGAAMVPAGWMIGAVGLSADALEIAIPGYLIFVSGTVMLTAGSLSAAYALKKYKRRRFPAVETWAGWIGLVGQLSALFGIWNPVAYCFSIGQLAHNQNQGGRELGQSAMVSMDPQGRTVSLSFRF